MSPLLFHAKSRLNRSATSGCRGATAPKSSVGFLVVRLRQSARCTVEITVDSVR
jgi:hypothetical protein